ncbi:facilitated trehalose transporter Tret1-like [Culicoides brevitarsis]|uniref:facilitated trehalose transporter Tret1-like n=1 Tax=Culicoides brevitarsis TaxID=469753 RepID=UPI00307C1BC6
MGGILKQYYAVISANIVTLIYGVAVGWPSASLPLLQSAESPLPGGPLTLLECSWIGSVLCLGGASGQIFFGWLAGKFGRKPAILFSFIPGVASWLLIAFGTGFYHLFIARFLSGFIGGAAFQVVPLIVSEVSSVQVRGSLGSLLILFHNGGIVVGYALCSYTDYFFVPWCGIGLCVIFLVSYLFVPETPAYLALQGDHEAAKKSRNFFKSDEKSEDFELESKKMMEKPEILYAEEEKFKFSDVFTPATKKALIIGVILANTVSFSGAFTLTNYYETIFREAGSSLSPAASSIIVASIQCAGSYSTTLTVERVGRKFLILASAYGSATCLAVMGLYSCLKDLNVDVSSYGWLPLLCLSLLVFIAANGASSVPYVVIGEIFAQNVRGFLVSVCNIANWTTSFILVLVFPYMIEYLKLYGALWVFTVIGSILATIIAFIMPETKGLSIERIVEILGSR